MGEGDAVEIEDAFSAGATPDHGHGVEVMLQTRALPGRSGGGLLMELKEMTAYKGLV